MAGSKVSNLRIPRLGISGMLGRDCKRSDSSYLQQIHVQVPRSQPIIRIDRRPSQRRKYHVRIPTVISQRRPSLVEKNGWSSLWGYIKIALSASARNNSLPVSSIWCCSLWRHTFTRFCHFSSLQIRVLYLHINVDRYPRQYPLVEFSSQNF